MPTRLLIATRNAHKLAEIQDILAVPDLDLVNLDRFPGLPEVVEDAGTFVGNAAKKACSLAVPAHIWTLADDSGLEVDALAGDPGVLSARYAGEPVSYAANNLKLLKELSGVADRRARFRCVIALANPRGEYRVVEGRCEGMIAEGPRGQNGFGYDPLFIPRGYTVTFAEIDPGIKNRISHRAMALRAAKTAWFEGKFGF